MFSSIKRFIWAWLGLNPDLPYIRDVKDPQHGDYAKNGRGQKVRFDASQGKWVMPQDFSDRPPVTITKP